MQPLSANNVTLTAMMVAVLAGTQGVSFLLKDYRSRLYQTFAGLCMATLLANVGLAFATVNQSRGWHVLHLLGSVMAGPATVLFFLELLGPPQPRGAMLRPALLPVGVALALLILLGFHPSLAGDVLPVSLEELLVAQSQAELRLMKLEDWWADIPGMGFFVRTVVAHPYRYGIALLVGTYMFTCFVCILLNVLDRRARVETRIERTRLTLLAWIGGFTVAGSLLQSTGYYFRLPIGTYPVGCLAQLAFLAFLSQAILVYRLLDLHEMLSRGLVFFSQVVVISGVYSILLVIFADRTSWVNLGVTIFLASGVVFAVQQPLRLRIERLFHRLFFWRRYALTVRLNELDKMLPRLLRPEAVFESMLSGLRATPQISHAAIFLWEERSMDFVLVRHTGQDAWPPVKAVASTSALARALLQRGGPLGLDELERELGWQREPRATRSALLAHLQRLGAQVVVPFLGGGTLIGFLALRDDSLHEGFTQDELVLLQQLADKAAVILQNSESIRRQQEQDRLAALGQMAAGMAHEIRNPLGAIRGAAEYLAESPDEPADPEFLDIIIEEADRLNRVVSDFLDYSRPLHIQREPCEPNRLVRQVVALLTAKGLPEGVQLRLELAESLPLLLADLERLKQVLLNLLQNALQALKGGGEVVVRTSRLRAGGFLGDKSGVEGVQIQVEDSGVGMSQEQLDKLFIPFFTTKKGGTGLGLAISQRLVQAHGGELEAQSVEGQGTVFSLILPLPEASELAEQESSGTGIVPGPLG